jgi:hypothetical protein
VGRWIWLLYLNGYSAGGEEERVKLLKCGIDGLWIGRLADSGCRNMRFVERFYDSPVLNEINILFWWIFWRLFIKLKTGTWVRPLVREGRLLRTEPHSPKSPFQRFVRA